LILYTVMPMEEVMQQEERRNIMEVRLRGRTLQIEPVSPAMGRIVRLISTDPNDYLELRFAPGNMVSFVFQ